MDDIEVITVVEEGKLFWRAIDHSTGIEVDGPTPSKAESNLRTTLNRFWRELESKKE